ncbi:MAG: hypothetical protein M1817_002137 [Caeruleum heppii]|nr:MAG: hypothetical protein M1817_002137 [Caeruleum heppii]
MSTNGPLVGQPTGLSSSPDPEEGQATLGIFEASSIAEIHATLAQLSDREASVTARLDSLVASQKDLSRELGRLDLLRAHLGPRVTAIRSIGNGMLSDAAATATRISSAVKALDLEQSRVKATLDVVEQVAELKTCVLGVTGSMGGAQDWEKAAGFLNRASKIPTDIVNGHFAEEIVPTAEIPDPPSLTLHNAAESLCGLFLREFEKAAKEGDGGKVTRFFKLFPLIGRSDVGLDIYGRYVCQGVATRARANLNAGTGANQRKDGFFYANALTKLFEHIAQIVDGHGGLVERHYGAGKMIKVIERLQLEADVQGGIILDTWSDERNINRRLTDIKSYAFSFLVRSFLPPQRGSAGTPRANSPAKREGTPGPVPTEEEDGVDMKEVDGFLSEMAVMLGRWALYSRFLADKCRSPSLDASNTDDTILFSMPDLLLESNLHKKVITHLIQPFSTMTTFFFRRSVEKAFQLDESPSDLSLNLSKPLPSNSPFITSAVDDVMYFVNTVLQRSLATSQRDVVAGVVPTVARVLGSDFVGMCQRKMRDESYPKPVVQGGLPPEDKIIAFLVLINNLDVANDYLKGIVRSRVETHPDANQNETPSSSSSSPLTDLFPFNHDAVFVRDALLSMEHTFDSKTAELISDGIHVAFDRVIKPRLRPILADAFRDVDYNLSDDQTSSTQPANGNHSPTSSDDPSSSSTDPSLVKPRFAHSWTHLLTPLTRLLTPRTTHLLLSTTIPHLSKILEKRLWALQGGKLNALGAVTLERDVAGIVAESCKGGRYGLRDAFQRCVEICEVVGLEGEEWDDLVGEWEGGNGEDDKEGRRVWRLDVEERRRARGMVVG